MSTTDIDKAHEGLRLLCVKHIHMSGSKNSCVSACINAMMAISELQQELDTRDATIGALIDLQTAQK